MYVSRSPFPIRSSLLPNECRRSTLSVQSAPSLTRASCCVRASYVTHLLRLHSPFATRASAVGSIAPHALRWCTSYSYSLLLLLLLSHNAPTAIPSRLTTHTHRTSLRSQQNLNSGACASPIRRPTPRHHRGCRRTPAPTTHQYRSLRGGTGPASTTHRLSSQSCAAGRSLVTGSSLFTIHHTPYHPQALAKRSRADITFSGTRTMTCSTSRLSFPSVLFISMHPAGAHFDACSHSRFLHFQRAVAILIGEIGKCACVRTRAVSAGSHLVYCIARLSCL